MKELIDLWVNGTSEAGHISESSAYLSVCSYAEPQHIVSSIVSDQDCGIIAND